MTEFHPTDLEMILMRLDKLELESRKTREIITPFLNYQKPTQKVGELLDKILQGVHMQLEQLRNSDKWNGADIQSILQHIGDLHNDVERLKKREIPDV